jgi:hypothetical protein
LFLVKQRTVKHQAHLRVGFFVGINKISLEKLTGNSEYLAIAGSAAANHRETPMKYGFKIKPQANTTLQAGFVSQF